MSYIDDYQLLENKWDTIHQYSCANWFANLIGFLFFSIKCSEIKIGHFTQIVAMKAKYIGCAMSKFLSGDDYEMNFYLVCNYSFGNMVSEPIYTSGPAASRCKSGRSITYKGLCNSTEDIQAIAGEMWLWSDFM